MNKGKVDVLLGLQWGDEGKGKVVDVLQHPVWYFPGWQGEHYRQWRGSRSRPFHE